MDIIDLDSHGDFAQPSAANWSAHSATIQAGVPATTRIGSTPRVAPVVLADRANLLMTSGQIVEGLDVLIAGLRKARDSMSPEQWKEACLFLRKEHPVCELLYQDPLTRRAFEKPRGYAGDAVLMDYICGSYAGVDADKDASEIGRAIFRHIRSRPTSQSVIYRKNHIAKLIDDQAAGSENPEILAIASGHLREAELSAALMQGKVKRFVALDADAGSLGEVATRYSRFGVETAHAAVRQLLQGKVDVGEFDFVYAAGLYDYLADNVAQALTAKMIGMTRPGGTILIPNYSPVLEGCGYMECFMDWHLIYRDEYEMVRLLEKTEPSWIENYDVSSDPWGSVLYLRVKRAAR